MKRIDELTGLRGIAVSMVVIGHSSAMLPVWFQHFGDIGYTGVEIFFVLSGFLITSLLLREHLQTGTIDFWAFYQRRLLRISPAFYAYLAFLGVLAGGGWIDVSWQEFLISGAYVWNYAHLLRIDGSFPTHIAGTWYVGHTWSLALEEQFYWIWPASFLVLYRRRFRLVLPGLIVAVPLVRIATYFVEPGLRNYLGLMFHTGADAILIGCFVAMNREALAARFGRFIKSGRLLAGSFVVLLVVIPLVETRLRGLWSATYGKTAEAALVGFILLCVMAQPGHWICRVLRSPGFMFVGLISYSLYLWQQLFANAGSPFFLGFPFNIAESIVAASISYYLIERPFLLLKDRVARRPVSVVGG